ncbi:MAG: alpha/beta hydrolase [Proteobacteria bacterium]|nr:alpha/beta hydrolase [Pseudomonadota bacterium]
MSSRLETGLVSKAAALLAAALLVTLSLARPALCAPKPIDLDTFDALKKEVRLPNGETLAYVPLGNPHGQPVILIHGYTDNARDWVPLVPYLDPKLRLILVDIRGHGASSKPECCYTRYDFAYDVKLLMDALHVQRADIVGHSLGSIIAQTFAEAWPEHTGHVVLIASTGGHRAGTMPRKPAYDFASEIRKLKEPIDPDSPFMVEWWSSPTPVDADFLRRQRKDAAAIPLRVWLAVLDQGVTDADLQRTLPKLASPTLLIWGSKDPIMQDEVRQTLIEALPHAQVKILAGLGHNPFWEDPAACAALINAFLAAAPQGAATH